MYDVVIIGAGIVGGLIARALSACELKVCIAEKENDVAMGTTKANSAIVHAGFDAPAGSLKAKLNVRGSELMPQIARELGVKYQRNGSLVLGFCEEDRAAIEALYERGCQNGVKDLKILNQEEVRVLEPALSEEVLFALHAPTGAVICPYELTIAAIGNAMDNGVELLRNFEVTDIRERGGIYEVCRGDQVLQTRNIINAAGIYADRIAAMVGDISFQIHPRRGEYLLLDRKEEPLVRHTIFRTPTKMGKGILVTPTVDGNLLAGPTSVDQEDKETAATTVDGFAQIQKQAWEYVPNLPFGETITSFCGLRAVGSTGDFIIDAPKRGFFNVAGIESPGLSASPAIAEYVITLLEKQEGRLQRKQNYQPYREPDHAFREASIEEKNAKIQKDPSYGKIVCRCEHITEGEILHAIHTNPSAQDLDGVKRRTRAQMGRCQGGFCGPQIVELLARELQIPYEQVTKSGKASYINVGKTKEVEA